MTDNDKALCISIVCEDDRHYYIQRGDLNYLVAVRKHPITASDNPLGTTEALLLDAILRIESQRRVIEELEESIIESNHAIESYAAVIGRLEAAIEREIAIVKAVGARYFCVSDMLMIRRLLKALKNPDAGERVGVEAALEGNNGQGN